MVVFCPPTSREHDPPIICVLDVVANHALWTNAVRNAMTGWMIAAIVSPNMWRSCLYSVRGRLSLHLLLFLSFPASRHQCRFPLASCLFVQVLE